MPSYRTDEEQLAFLEKRIARLEKTLETLETLSLSSISTGGNSRAFRNQEDIRHELDRATREYKLISDRINGTPTNPHFRTAIICDRKAY